jgi:FKBP-type peptidyl-prolyl cis-trans isomerase
MIKSRSRVILILLSVFLVISLGSCDPSKKFEDEENMRISDYLMANGDLNFEQKPSGLYYLELTAGTGRTPIKHDTVCIKYTGSLLSGEIFDTNTGSTDTLAFPFQEGWVLKGIDEGLTYMKEGGRAKLLLPSKLAFGPTGYYYISGYTPLLYDIQLVKVKPGPGK